MRKNKGLGFMFAFLMAIAFLTVNVFAEEESNFYSDTLGNEIVLDEESSIFDLAVYITQQAIKIMDSTTERDEITQLVDNLLSEYGLEDQVDLGELIGKYKYYEEFYKDEFEDDPWAYIDYIKEEKALLEISDAINLAVTDEIEDAIEDEKTDIEVVNSINQILDKYKLTRDLDGKEILADYYQNKEDIEELERTILRIYEKYEFEKWVHYNIISFVNKAKDLESDEEISNQINALHRKLGIWYSSPTDLQDAYKRVIDYDIENKVKTLSEYVINTINDNNIKDTINEVYESIIYSIYYLQEDAIYDELYNLLKRYDVESFIDEIDLSKSYRYYEEYGYESGETAVLNEVLKGLDLEYTEEEINTLIDKIIELMNANGDDLMSSLDSDFYEDLSEEFGDEISYTFKEYDFESTFDFSRILGVYSNYKENGFDSYEEPLLAEIKEMLKNTKLQEKIIDIIGEMGETDSEEKIVEKISDQLEEKHLEKYADYEAIKEIINDENLDSDSRDKGIAEIIISAIVYSERKDIFDIYEEVTEEIAVDLKYAPISSVLEEYEIREYIHPREVIEMTDEYERWGYSSPREALYEEVFKLYTKAFSSEHKNNLKDEIIKILKAEDSEDIDFEEYIYAIYKELKYYDINGYVKSDDLLNIFNDYDSLGYSSQKEGILKEIINGIVKKIEVEIVEVMDSGKEEVAIKKSVSRILKSNDLQYKIDAGKILDIYTGYDQYGFDDPAQALNSEIRKLFQFILESEEKVTK